ncbi:hypothetical protein QFC24_004086 [Naganishia onofrii]|uniref:Uncharacterized protein n=1 Tax=Naganishia onofrii TaxID=1851511 RepID=A0ACC2XGA3_9TREE|nr:hypothetical protein QFC24_004086 [Naganishia onofrii]
MRWKHFRLTEGWREAEYIACWVNGVFRNPWLLLQVNTLDDIEFRIGTLTFGAKYKDFKKLLTENLEGWKAEYPKACQFSVKDTFDALEELENIISSAPPLLQGGKQIENDEADSSAHRNRMALCVPVSVLESLQSDPTSLPEGSLIHVQGALSSKEPPSNSLQSGNQNSFADEYASSVRSTSALSNPFQD